MKLKFLNKNCSIFNIIIIIYCFNSIMNINPEDSYYYEEKYFRILSNNYRPDIIATGENWQFLDDGIGFKAKKDYGSLILLKDWSMYNFKLTEIVFRNQSSVDIFSDINDTQVEAEMWLIHTKDNEYYPPGRRIYLKQNYFIIIVPFVRTSNENPAIDSIFHYLNLNAFANKKEDENASPIKEVKLHQIIQNQPSYLFEGTYDQKETLFMAFSQYHFISDDDLYDLNKALYINNKTLSNLTTGTKFYRNAKNSEDLKPKVSLMIYSQSNYLKNFLFFLILFLF